ncbi:DUF2963 domain-containing protein [Candidatus Phytoplasma tritici]|uniref:DUF2963 domain-containing protein n=1 Tax=Candidatus Phytoplasma tritici TaxID=321961 RepID=UPI00040C60BE|nr:DUF2963 domain-containing protein [Candidatus Phytoplasma tritici]
MKKYNLFDNFICLLIGVIIGIFLYINFFTKNNKELEIRYKIEQKQPDQTSSLKYLPITFYKPDCTTINYINEYNKDTGNLIKKTYYKTDGKIIDYIEEYNKDIGKLIKTTYFCRDGKTIDYIEKYDLQTGKKIKIYYNPDGTVKEIINN